MSLVTCQRCGKTFEVSKATGIKYCSDCREEIKKEKRLKQGEIEFQKRQEKLLKGVEGVDYVIDRWNGYATKTIGSSWMKHQHPGKTVEDYIREFPDAPLVCESTSKILSENSKAFMNSPEAKKYFSEIMSGDRNPNSKCNTTEEYRKSISPFSKSFKGYVGMTDDEKSKIIKERWGTDRNDRSTNQVGYWLKLGYSEEEAKHLVSERQRTFTLEKCIEKHGLEDGYRIWKERQEKWSQKVEQQYRDGLFSKVPHSQNTSMISNSEREFINDLLNIIGDGNDVSCYKTRQMELLNEDIDRCKNRRFSYDFAMGNKIIEFNGDFWHMNPEKYKEDFYNKISKISAKDKWEIDAIKINCAKSYGYEVLVVWESDYRKDRDATIRKCIEFLKI